MDEHAEDREIEQDGDTSAVLSAVIAALSRELARAKLDADRKQNKSTSAHARSDQPVAGRCEYCLRYWEASQLIYGRPFGLTHLTPRFACIDCITNVIHYFEELTMPDMRWALWTPRERSKRTHRKAKVSKKVIVPSKRKVRQFFAAANAAKEIK